MTTGSGHYHQDDVTQDDPQDYDNDETDDTSQEQLPQRLPSLFRCNYQEMLQLQRQDEEIPPHLTTRDKHDDGINDDTTRTSTILPNGERVLNYEHFLDRNDSDDDGCYDDLKHVDYHYIDYGYCGGGGGDYYGHDYDSTGSCGDTRRRFHPPLLIQQNKRIPGKGGFCWDAAFILGEYLIHCTLKQLLRLPIRVAPLVATTSTDDSKITTIRMIELGCGTGICGMYLAKHLSSLPPTTRTNQYHIILTDMAGPIQTLLQNNLRRNFQHYSKEEMGTFSEYFAQRQYPPISPPSPLHPESSDEKDTTCNKNQTSSNETTMIEAAVLDWDECYKTKHTAAPDADNMADNTPPQQPEESETYDIVFGSDIVASIYDPIQLAYTIFYLCHAQSVVYLSYKERLSRIHAIFQTAMTEMFQHVRIFNTCTGTTVFDTNIIHSDPAVTAVDNSNDDENDFISRNGNPNVYIIIASHPKPKSTWRTVDLMTEQSEYINNYK